jgi:hypothetical protein
MRNRTRCPADVSPGEHQLGQLAGRGDDSNAVATTAADIGRAWTFDEVVAPRPARGQSAVSPGDGRLVWVPRTLSRHATCRIRRRATVLGTHTYSCSNPRATTRKTAPAPYRNDHPRVTTRGPG